ncbi:hypothetical protein [Actinocorallia populi]|uniref:hypothetical protein n=1 Tax=Actinocorallia populi TaxID=2079200 RepID=UPI000D091407|nr:hypothetical protein [Actinocorallia populi]
MLPQADEVSPWSSAPAGNDPWPPEPWQPEPVRQDRQAGPPPQDDRPWAEQPQEPQWGGQPPERPWGGQPPERPWSDGPQERPWSDGPQERPWSDQPGDRPWAGQPQPQPQPQRPWAEQPGEARPWDADPGPRQWGGGPQQQQSWSAGPEQQNPPSRNDGEQWLPDEGPRWRGPLIAGLIAMLLTAAIVVGYVFWTKDDDGSGRTASPPGTSQEPGSTTSPDDAAEGDPAAGDPQVEAQAVDTLLGDMSASRKKLSTITYTCANKDQDIATFKTAIEEREGQLSTAGELSLSALDNGEAVKKALVDALQASIDSNQEALTWLADEDGCDKDAAARLKDVTDKATDTKREFLDLWNPIATEQGLQTWTRETI